MRLFAAASWSAALAAGALAGCTQNPYLMQGQVTNLQQQQVTLTQRNQELQSRATTLDQDNQELQTLLAQSRQQSRLLDDQLAAVRKQLTTVTAQLSQTQMDKVATEKKAEALVVNTRKRGSAAIPPNNSLTQNLPAMNFPGVEVRQDGDVIRIELPESKLFDPNGMRLRPTAAGLLDAIAAELVRDYPEQIIGVEGHTDSDPLRGAAWVNSHQLSTNRAMSVFEYLTSRSKLNPKQLFVVGHGANHPVVSNGTPAGRERNRRVELVVYPDKVGG